MDLQLEQVSAVLDVDAISAMRSLSGIGYQVDSPKRYSSKKVRPLVEWKFGHFVRRRGFIQGNIS